MAIVFRKGVSYFDAWFDDESQVVGFSEYVCRTVNKNGAYLIEKNSVTWGKRSKKHGDVGWLDPIAPCWRKHVAVDGVRSQHRLGLTKRAALKNEIAAERKHMAHSRHNLDAQNEGRAYIAAYERALGRYPAKARRPAGRIGRIGRNDPA